MRQRFGLFDFDGTLISGDSIIRFCAYARQKGLCTAKEWRAGIWAGALYLLGRRTAEQSKMAALSFINGKTQRELAVLSKSFCREILRPRLRPEGIAEIKRLKAEGAQILLITASPSFYLESMKELLGVTEIIGTRMDMGGNGKATGLICGENCKGLQKPLRLAEYLAAKGQRLDYENSWAYGDSLSDWPMLELCAHKIGVNPKAKLRRKLSGVEGAARVRWKG